MSTPVVVVSGAGTPGPRGTGWLTGAGAPSDSLGFDGDLYLDTTNTGVFYGPKTAGVWGSPHPFTILKSNSTATTDPTVSNDNTQGYVVGSFWVNTTVPVYYVASSVATGAAVWTPILPVGTTSGTVAAGNDSRIAGAAQKSANLSDLASAAAARLNLGLGDAATANIGTTVGTVAAGDDTRIVDALQNFNNLSDVSDVPTSRTNLGLGTSATADIGTGPGTVAAGNDSRIVGAIQTGESAGGDLGSTYPNPTVTATHLSAPLPVGQGGTGSGTKNFVDLTTSQTIGGAKTFTSEVSVPSPTQGSSAVNKTYADGLASGVAAKGSVIAATAGPLPSNTYNNGSSGVGATLTATAVGTLVVDTHTAVLNDRILVKDEASPQNNGIYSVTTAGSPSVAYVLTRTTDMDQPTEIPAAFTFVTSGSANISTGWIVTGAGPYTIGTTPIVWTQFSGAGTIVAGTGLELTGNTIILITPVAAENLPDASTSALGIVLIDGTATDIQPLGAQSAGSTGKVADAGHVHPTTGVTLHSEAATTVVPETSYGLSSSVGTDVTYAREDHTHGTPSLTNSAPGATLAIGTVASVGVATTPARSDHVHPMAAAGSPTNSAVGDTAVTGSATSFAASNHVHGRESFGLVSPETVYGLASSSGVSTSVSRSDHTHGTPQLTTTPPSTVLAIGTAAALGVATTPALADHVHPVSGPGTPTTSAVGDVTATGVATTFAASDHRHGRESFGNVVALSSFGASPSNGSASTVSHSDHVHGSPALPTASTSVQGIVQLAGDLAGTSTSPVVARVNGTSVTNAPATSGQDLISTSGSAASWQTATTHSTGLYTGGQLTYNSSTSFNIAAGSGQIVDYINSPLNPTITKVSFPTQTVTLNGTQLAQTANWIAIDSSGTVLVQSTEFSPTERRSVIQLGVVPCVGGAITSPISVPQFFPQGTSQLYDLMFNLGSFNASPGGVGNYITANGANLRFNFTNGNLFAPGFNYGNDPRNPHLVQTISETPAGFFTATRVPGSEAAATVLDNTHYDNNGVLTNVPANGNATNQRVYLFGNRVVGQQLVIQYGSAVYTNLATAVSNLGTGVFTVNPDIALNDGTLIAYISITKQCTSLQDTANALITTVVNRFASS